MRYSENVKKNNPIIYTVIRNSINNQTIPHAVLFVADENQSIHDEYLFFIQDLISNDGERNPLAYPDLVVIDGSEEIIKKEYVIDAINRLQQTPLDECGKKFLVIKNIENSNKQSINSLLKFIEEPTKETYILITTNNKNKVLTTIKSRSQILTLKRVNIDVLNDELVKSGINEDYSRIFASIYKEKAEAIDSFKNNFIETIDSVINILKNSITNPELIMTEMPLLINKNNYKIIFKLILEFYSDVWRFEQLQTLTFPKEASIIEKYKNSGFNFTEAIIIINKFLDDMNRNTNLNLQLDKLLINLKEVYNG